MKERIVQHIKQNEDGEAETADAALPAPMVERAFRLLELLSDAEEGMTLSDLARALHMSKGSIHGLLKTLESTRVVEQEEERRFVLGPRIYDLSQAYIHRAGLRHFALPAMRRLAASTGETVCLGKIEQKGVRIIECIVDNGKQVALHISAHRGQLVPLLVVSVGSCVLASWPVAQRETFLQTHPLPRFTRHSITDPQQFLNRVNDAERTGIGFDYEEYLDGVNAIAAPIYATGHTLVGLLWIFGFASRLRDEALESATQQLRVEAQTISRALGASQ
jgi:DNA-binding IclR family transcriptional regulator